MEELLQPLDIDQIVMLLEAINCEEVDNKFWMVFSSDYTWNAKEVFGSGEDTFFESGYYITVMYNNENPFPTFQKYSYITSSFPHYDYWIESDQCEDCYFYDKNGCNVRGKFECIDKYRSDHKNVIFKQVKE